MSSKNFVQQLLGDTTIAKVSDKYLSENELPEDTVARVLLTGILKNQFYRSADDAAKEALPLFIDRAKKAPLFLLKALCVARNSHMKGMVKVAIAALGGSASEEFLNDPINRKAIVSVLGTFHPGQLIQFVELCKSKKFGRGFGSRTQKWVREVMEGWSAQRLEILTLKYPTDLNALVRLVHPRYTDVRKDIIVYILDGKKDQAIGTKQVAVESLKKLSDKFVIAKQMLEHEIPWDVIKGFAGLDGPLALSSLTQMGLTALLLNIRSLEEHKAFDNKDGITALKLKMNEVKNGRSLPIDFAKPYIFATNQKVKDILLDAMADTLDVPMGNLEGLDVGVSIDISGSMSGETLQTAGLLAVPFLKAKNLWFTTFDTSLYEEGYGKQSRSCYNNGGFCPQIKGLSKKDQIKNLLGLNTAGGTDVAISIRKATETKRKMDVIVLITDEQQNAGTPLMQAWHRYKKMVNKNAQLWVINATNLPWHSADFGDRSVTVYQTMTPALFKNLEWVGQNLVQAINKFDLNSIFNKG